MSSFRTLPVIVFLLCFSAVAPGQASSQTNPPSAAAPAATGQQAGAAAVAPSEKSGAKPEPRRIFARSDTVYMSSETIAKALQGQPEFESLNLALTDNRWRCELFVEVKRPVFTWDWTYTLVDTSTGREISKGKVTAATAERAAHALAPLILSALVENTKGAAPSRAASVAPATAATKPAVPAVPAGSKRFVSPTLAQRIQVVKKIQLRSETVWFDKADLQKNLRVRPEMIAWGYELVTEEDGPHDLRIVINRPLFTWDWTYTMVDPGNKAKLAQGRITAIDGPHAAQTLAAEIVRTFAAARGLPPGIRHQYEQALAETKVRSWDVRHISGQTHIGEGKKIRFVIGEKTLSARRNGDILFSATSTEMVEFLHSTKVTDRSVAWFQFWDKVSNELASGAEANPGGFLAVILPIIGIDYSVGGILKAAKVTDHYVVLYWRDTFGVVSTATLKMNDTQAAEILAELERLTKRSALDLDAGADKRREQLEQAAKEDLYVELDRDVTVGTDVLAPGRYRVIVVPGETGRGEVYFVRGAQLQAGNLAGRAVVEHARRSDGQSGAHVEYTTQAGVPVFSEIRIGDHHLRFTAVPVFPEQVSSEPAETTAAEDLMLREAKRAPAGPSR
jgi:hypothetical protein